MKCVCANLGPELTVFCFPSIQWAGSRTGTELVHRTSKALLERLNLSSRVLLHHSNALLPRGEPPPKSAVYWTRKMRQVLNICNPEALPDAILASGVPKLNWCTLQLVF